MLRYRGCRSYTVACRAAMGHLPLGTKLLHRGQNQYFPIFWPFFTQISGRNFLPEHCGEVHPGIAPLQALRCALSSTEQSTFRGGEKGEKVPRKGKEEGWPAKGAKRKKGRVKTSQFFPNSGRRKRGVGFKGGSRHDRNRHNRRNRQNRQNRHGRLLALYFVGRAKGGQGALQNRQTRQNRQNRHEGYPP